MPKIICGFAGSATEERAREYAAEHGGRVVDITSLSPEELQEAGFDVWGKKDGTVYQRFVIDDEANSKPQLIRFTPANRKGLRRAAYETDRSITALVNEAVKEWLSKRNNEAPAK